MKEKVVQVGIIGGGLMGKEVASALGRWFSLVDFPVHVELKAVCDLDPKALDWYRRIPSVTLLTTDYRELLASQDISVVYVALPHHLHKQYYIDVLEAGKDLLAEKPFGIDLASATEIRDRAKALGRFVRCSSEMPFLPGPQRLLDFIHQGKTGEIIEINAGFCHSSDMDPQKPVNWKRQSAFCGEIGVMGDLGAHVLHIPMRMGWKPSRVFAQLQRIITERPDGKGGLAPCDTWNNATVSASVEIGTTEIPMILEMKRLAPGETNTWYIEVLGKEGGVKYSTKDTKVLWTYERSSGDGWKRVDLGFGSVFPTITGGIFEAGFPDCFMQMLAAFFAERAGMLEGRFGCLTPDEAVSAHAVFGAALRSQEIKSSVEI